MKPVIILLNGPRRSGKDTAAEAIKRAVPGTFIRPLALPMKLDALRFYELDADMLDFYESVKDDPNVPEFKGRSFRQRVIEHSADCLDMFGDDYWVKKWAIDAQDHFDVGASVVIMSDCRFQRELDAALAIAPGTTLLMRVYRTSKCQHEPDAWTGDIGSWLFPPVADVPQVALINDGDIRDHEYLSWNAAYHFVSKVNR